MPARRAPRSLYAAFDRFPSAKGAATHIDVFARALFEHRDPGLLYVLGDIRLPARQIEPDGTEIVRFGAQMESMLERGVAYGRRLGALLQARGDQLELAQFRDPWSGVAIVAHGGRAKTIYELNGLPSIELPAHRPRMAPQTIAKLAEAEAFCLRRADAVVCPSKTLAAAAIARGADPHKLTVIANGAGPPPSTPPPRPPDAPKRPYVLYFGALQPWQGVATLLRALAELRDVCDLVICSSQHGRHAKPLRKLARRLGLEQAIWRFELPREQLAPWLAHAALSAAPLSDCPRNTVQGCAPLKLVESFAAGVPVVASDLPAVREIVTLGKDGILVPPDRPGALARAIRLALDDPQELGRLGAAGHQTWRRRFTWDASASALRDLLDALGTPQLTKVA